MTALTTWPFLTVPSGAASFTEAVITSPRPAREPASPPTGNIMDMRLAPELSATSSMDLICTIVHPLLYHLEYRSADIGPPVPTTRSPCLSLIGALDNFSHSPSLASR